MRRDGPDHDGRAGPQGDARRPDRRGSIVAQEGSLAGRHARAKVHGHPENTPAPERPQEPGGGARRRTPDDVHAVGRSQPFVDARQPRVVALARDGDERYSRGDERCRHSLPRAEVSRGEHDAATLGAGLLERAERIRRHGQRIECAPPEHPDRLAQPASERLEAPGHELLSLAFVELRKSQGNVAQGDPPGPSCEAVCGPSQRTSERTHDARRQGPHGSQRRRREQPDGRVLGALQGGPGAALAHVVLVHGHVPHEDRTLARAAASRCWASSQRF